MGRQLLEEMMNQQKETMTRKNLVQKLGRNVTKKGKIIARRRRKWRNNSSKRNSNAQKHLCWLEAR